LQLTKLDIDVFFIAATS